MIRVTGWLRGFLLLIRGDDEARYRLAERVARAVHPDAVLPERGRMWLSDTEFRSLYASFEPTNLRRMDRVWTLRELARMATDVPGDTAECGTYSGLSSVVICSVLHRAHHVFDSFEGLSPPTSLDGDHWSPGDLASPEDLARQRLSEFDVEFHTGWIPTRFEDVAHLRFAFVHLDVDLYEPTRDSLLFFIERLAPGGILVCDDSGFRTCPGARAAVVELAQTGQVVVSELATGQAVIQLSRGAE